MKRAGPTLMPAIACLVIGGAVLFFSDATWLRMTSAMVALLGIALAVFAIVTPEFLERDLDGE